MYGWSSDQFSKLQKVNMYYIIFTYSASFLHRHPGSKAYIHHEAPCPLLQYKQHSLGSFPSGVVNQQKYWEFKDDNCLEMVYPMYYSLSSIRTYSVCGYTWVNRIKSLTCTTYLHKHWSLLPMHLWKLKQ